LNVGKTDEAAAVFDKYIFTTDINPKTGKPYKSESKGLKRRRKQEKELFLGVGQ
jgi:uncharacterized protein YjhX (UPF0386 family)